jgi:hypothetical protein
MAMVQELYFNLASKEPRFCDVVVPMPLDQAGNSYDWCCKNWGTKWDVAEVWIDHEGLVHTDDLKVAWFSFRCWTAWAPPVPVWDRLHAMGIEVHANYQDEGGMFAGEYHHGEDKCWQPAEEAVA